MIRALLLFVGFALVSCTLKPSYVLRTGADGTTTEILTGGATILTKADYEESIVRKGDIVLEHRVKKKDEVAVPRYRAWGEVGRAAADEIGDLGSEIIDAATN